MTFEIDEIVLNCSKIKIILLEKPNEVKNSRR